MGRSSSQQAGLGRVAPSSRQRPDGGQLGDGYNRRVLICLSASHKNSDFALLERLSVDAERLGRRIVDRHERLGGAVVVATCNRFEAYLDLDEPFGNSPLGAILATLDVVADAAGVGTDELRESLDLAHGNAVAEHLFAVASGLESVVVGEGEISGQVRRSLEAARAEGTTSPELERLFQRASQTSRAVKNRTGIGSAGRSLVRLALDLASSRVRDWSQTRVLLVGTGRYAGASLAALRERGVEDVEVFSPSGRGAKFAANHGIPVVLAEGFAQAAASADVVVTCSAVESHVLHAADLLAGRTHVAARRQLLIDLGLPRNIAPDVATVDGVELLDLETIRLHAPLEQFDAAADDAQALVTKAARKFGAVADENDLAPAVVALRSHVFGLLDAEIERSRGRDDAASVEAALRHFAGVLLHTPMVRSREYARAGEQAAWIEGLEALFGVAPDAASPAASERDSAARDSTGRSAG
jgi:glutamyl-tRNA reductase